MEEDLKQFEMEQLRKREKFLAQPSDIRKYISLINEINDTYSTWGLDITSLAENIVKDYPTATQLMLSAKNGLQIPREDELKFYKLLRNYVDLSYKKVQMEFTHEDIDYKHLLYWGPKFLNMDGIDTLYTLYLLLEPQLQEETTTLNGTFGKNNTKLILPNMTFSAQKNEDTNINLNINTIGNLSMTIKNR